MRRSVAFAVAATAGCAAVAVPLRAQGSSVDQHSACMTGRVGAGVASPCDDASAVYFSPAALATTPSAIGVGLTLVRSGNEFRYDAGRSVADPTVTRETESVPVPHAYANLRVGRRAAVGIGVFAPYGLGLTWPSCSVDEVRTADCTPEQDFEGRYTGYDNSLRNIYVQPTVAYQLVPGRLSVGAGLDYITSTIEVNQRADAPQAGLRGVDIADVKLSGDATAFTFHVGAVAQLSRRTSLGVRYLHSAKLDVDGDADFERIPVNTLVDALLAPQFAEGGALADQGITTQIELPFQLVVGVSHRPTERLNLLVDYQRTGWSAFDQFDIDFASEGVPNRQLVLNYENTNTFRFAADYGATDALAVRAGFRYNTAASPRATPFLPEGERNYYTLGLGYKASSRLGIDAGWQYINQPDRRGSVRPNEPTVGVYSSTGQVFSVTASYRFGGAGR